MILDERIEAGPKNPDLLPCQTQMKQLCDDILSLRPEGYTYTFMDLPSHADPNAVHGILLESPFADLLLKDSDSLSHQESNEHPTGLDLSVGSSPLVAVSLRAWGWNFDKDKIISAGLIRPSYGVAPHSQDNDWMRRLEIMLHYQEGDQAASQIINMHTSSSLSGKLPSISRLIYANSRSKETGYSGHNCVQRDVTDEAEAMYFIALAQELFANRLTPSAP